MKLTKQDCCEEFREDIRRALGGRVVTGWLGNYEISSEAHSEKGARGVINTELVWTCVRRKDDVYSGRRMLRMELPGKRTQGRPKTKFMDALRESMAVTEEDTEDRTEWRWNIRCGDPWWEKPKEEAFVRSVLCLVSCLGLSLGFFMSSLPQLSIYCVDTPSFYHRKKLLRWEDWKPFSSTDVHTQAQEFATQVVFSVIST